MISESHIGALQYQPGGAHGAGTGSFDIGIARRAGEFATAGAINCERAILSVQAASDGAAGGCADGSDAGFPWTLSNSLELLTFIWVSAVAKISDAMRGAWNVPPLAGFSGCQIIKSAWTGDVYLSICSGQITGNIWKNRKYSMWFFAAVKSILSLLWRVQNRFPGCVELIPVALPSQWVRSCQFVHWHGDLIWDSQTKMENISHGYYQAVSGLAYIDAVELILRSGDDDAIVIKPAWYHIGKELEILFW